MILEKISSGKYVIAVSGGVDSVVLLDILSKKPGLDLVVAHFDHGIRPNSIRDRRLVEKLAKEHKLQFVFAEGRLGPKASEEKARNARYAFLNKVRRGRKAKAIITAHHQDDVLETAILNLIRGTGRRGLTSLGNQENISRPLLNIPKSELISYAKSHNLSWHEDETNSDVSYKRNYIRHQLITKLSPAERASLLRVINSMKVTNAQLDTQLASLLKTTNNQLDRQWFNSLPHAVAKEILIGWLRGNAIYSYDKNGLEKLVTNLKTSGFNRKYPVNNGIYIAVNKENLALV
jgi:tRNA(Ile)-lysidine synthase